tara:strand:- start:185 stop:544 length:360 start_codon:yes stop_codon:yes gene_type:complete
MEGYMPKKDMGLKRKNLTGYMGGGVFKPNAPVSSSFRGGGATEVGTENKVESYKEYAKKMFGGGGTGTPEEQRRQQGTGVGVRSTSRIAGGESGRKRTPKKIRKKRPTFTPTKADDKGM